MMEAALAALIGIDSWWSPVERTKGGYRFYALSDPQISVFSPDQVGADRMRDEIERAKVGLKKPIWC